MAVLLTICSFNLYISHKIAKIQETRISFTLDIYLRIKCYEILANKYQYDCGIVCHYPIYGDRLLIGRSNLLYACAKHPFALFSASRWHRRAGGLQPARTRTMVVSNKM